MQVAVSNPRIVQNVNHEDDENYYVSLYGSERIAEQTINPISSSSTGGTTTFSFQPPSTGTIMDKVILLQVQVTLTSSINNAATTYLTPKAWPINNSIQTLQVTIISESHLWKGYIRVKNYDDDLLHILQHLEIMIMIMI